MLVLAGSATLAAYVARRAVAPAKKPTPPAAKPAPAVAPAAVAPRPKAAAETIEPAESVALGEVAAQDPKRATAKAPGEKPPEEKIILGPDDSDGAGEVIIVPAPRTKKLPPLFTPEDYKKNGRRSTRF